MSRTHWLNRAPASIAEEGLCARGEPDPTSVDRRWLWRLESYLAIYGTTPGHHEMGRDLQEYLNETCEHHWHHAEAEPDIPAHKQCSWCNDVVWRDGAP